MATVPVARSTETLAPLPGQRQQVQRQDSGLGEGLQSLGQGLQQFAKGRQIYLDKVDEATVADLDSSFANDVRQIERTFTAAQGKNAVDIAADTQSAWAKTRASYLSRANNPTQAAMLNQVLDRRGERWANQYDSHLTTQADVWQTEAFKGRVATMSVDVADLPVNSVERGDAIIALGAVLDAEAQRQGWDADTRKSQGATVFSGIHENTVKALVLGDPHEAEAYLNDHADQILPEVRTRLTDAVRTEVYAKDAFTDAHDLPDRSPAAPATVETPAGKVTLLRPVAATALRGNFGERRSTHTHAGIDIATAVRSPVVASADGVIRWKNDPNGYGRYAVIDHGGGLETRYAHMSAANIPEGTRVTAGQTIGLSGGARGAEGSGNSQGPHLHYEVRQNGQAVDPTTALASGARSSGGTTTTITAAQPQSLEDAISEAARVAEARRPGDWRYAKAVEDALIGRYSRTRSIAADRERQAQDAIAPYLPGGAQAAASFDAVPASVRSALSPTQDTQYRNVFRSAQEGDAAVDPAEAGRTYQDLLDVASADPASFLAIDPYSYTGQLTNGQINSLRSTQRTIRDAKPEKRAEVNALLSGVSDVVNEYVEQAKITDPAEKARLIQHVIDVGSMTETPPDRNTQISILRLATRTVSVDDGRDNDPNTRTDVPFYQSNGRPTREAMSREWRNASIASLRRDYPTTANFTPEQIAARYRRLLVQRAAP